jgi:hypothetical protein
MPDKNEATERIGGPGASHENRDKPPADSGPGSPAKPDRDTQHSRVSGGGGEADTHHTHDDARK